MRLERVKYFVGELVTPESPLSSTYMRYTAPFPEFHVTAEAFAFDTRRREKLISPSVSRR